MPQATPSARKASALYSSSPSGVLTAPFTGDLCYVHGPNTLTHTHTHTRPSPLLHQVFSTVLGTYFPCGRKYPLRGDWDSVSSSHVVLFPLYNP